jgi:hypothetical protein
MRPPASAAFPARARAGARAERTALDPRVSCPASRQRLSDIVISRKTIGCAVRQDQG